MSRAVACWCKVKMMQAGLSITRTQSPACTLHRLHATLACASHCTALAFQWKTRPLSIIWRLDSLLQKGWVSKPSRDSHPKHCHTPSSYSDSSSTLTFQSRCGHLVVLFMLRLHICTKFHGCSLKINGLRVVYNKVLCLKVPSFVQV